MTMITITDDRDKTWLFDLNDKTIINKRTYIEEVEEGSDSDGIIYVIDIKYFESKCMRFEFKTQESRQKVWDRLCEITGAKDIFDPDIDEDMSLPPIPPCCICGKDAAEIFELDKNAIMHNYCRDCAKISKEIPIKSKNAST